MLTSAMSTFNKQHAVRSDSVKTKLNDLEKLKVKGRVLNQSYRELEKAVTMIPAACSIYQRQLQNANPLSLIT